MSLFPLPLSPSSFNDLLALCGLYQTLCTLTPLIHFHFLSHALSLNLYLILLSSPLISLHIYIGGSVPSSPIVRRIVLIYCTVPRLYYPQIIKHMNDFLLQSWVSKCKHTPIVGL